MEDFYSLILNIYVHSIFTAFINTDNMLDGKYL